MSSCDHIRERFFAEGAPPRGDPELESHLEACPCCRMALRGLAVVDAVLAQLPRCADDAPPPFTPRVARAAAQAARGRRRRVLAHRAAPFAATAAAAAVVALVMGVTAGRNHKPAPRLVEAGLVLDDSAGASLGQLPSGARLTLERGAVRCVRATADEERLALDRGTVSLEVPHLGAGRTLSVETPDALVRVRGTRFQVARDELGTTVSVTEGEVEVRPEGPGRPVEFVHPGARVVVEPLAAYRRGLLAAAGDALAQGWRDTADEQLTRLLATEPEPPLRAHAESLQAWAAAANGEATTAIRLYRSALARVPAGETPTWADNALAELALLLEAREPAAALAAWREYLDRFPQGLHAAQARGRLELEEGRR